jgi:acetyl-CoA carboxylase beta subunit
MNLKLYALIKCQKCRKYLYCRTDRKTTSCPWCRHQIKLDFSKVQVFYTTDSTKEILTVLKRFKAEV